jgi:hypothetical protein
MIEINDKGITIPIDDITKPKLGTNRYDRIEPTEPTVTVGSRAHEETLAKVAGLIYWHRRQTADYEEKVRKLRRAKIAHMKMSLEGSLGEQTVADLNARSYLRNLLDEISEALVDGPGEGVTVYVTPPETQN